MKKIFKENDFFFCVFDCQLKILKKEKRKKNSNTKKLLRNFYFLNYLIFILMSYNK